MTMDVSTTWAGVTLIIALVAIPFFRRQLGDLIGRITELWGVKADVPAVQPKPKEISKEISDSSQKDVSGTQEINVTSLQAPVFAEVEKELRAKGLAPELERKYLIHNVVQARFLLHYMRAARFVFGSQLQLLTQANGAEGPVPIVQAKEIYKSAARQYRAIYRNFSFETWLRFLVDNRFVEVHQDKVIATDLGRDFMTYLVSNHDTGSRVG